MGAHRLIHMLSFVAVGLVIAVIAALSILTPMFNLFKLIVPENLRSAATFASVVTFVLCLSPTTEEQPLLTSILRSVFRGAQCFLLISMVEPALALFYSVAPNTTATVPQRVERSEFTTTDKGFVPMSTASDSTTKDGNSGESTADIAMAVMKTVLNGEGVKTEKTE